MIQIPLWCNARLCSVIALWSHVPLWTTSSHCCKTLLYMFIHLLPLASKKLLQGIRIIDHFWLYRYPGYWLWCTFRFTQHQSTERGPKVWIAAKGKHNTSTLSQHLFILIHLECKQCYSQWQSLLVPHNQLLLDTEREQTVTGSRHGNVKCSDLIPDALHIQVCAYLTLSMGSCNVLWLEHRAWCIVCE